ncbi:MAG: Flp family type IVb pilin [Hyphomonadaceae bacterium]|nr:Flp family type IVb pilin [Hyphomonadaceae bacterium]
MQDLKHLWSRFAHDTGGASAIEYGLIAALIAVAALGGMLALSSGVSESWGNTAQKVSGAMN